MDYQNKVFDYLRSLETNTIIELKAICELQNIKGFIDIVKLFIDSQDEEEDGYCIELNSDHSRIRKLEYNHKSKSVLT